MMKAAEEFRAQKPVSVQGETLAPTLPQLVPAQKSFLTWAFLGNIVLFLQSVQFIMKTIHYFKLENNDNI